MLLNVYELNHRKKISELKSEHRFVIYAICLRILTRLRILPIGIESKEDIGAWNNKLSN